MNASSARSISPAVHHPPAESTVHAVDQKINSSIIFSQCRLLAREKRYGFSLFYLDECNRIVADDFAEQDDLEIVRLLKRMLEHDSRQCILVRVSSDAASYFQAADTRQSVDDLERIFHNLGCILSDYMAVYASRCVSFRECKVLPEVVQ